MSDPHDAGRKPGDPNPDPDQDLRTAIERLAQAIRAQGEEIRALARTIAKIEQERQR